MEKVDEDQRGRKPKISILQQFRAHSFDIQADYYKKYHKEKDDLDERFQPVNMPEFQGSEKMSRRKTTRRQPIAQAQTSVNSQQTGSSSKRRKSILLQQEKSQGNSSERASSVRSKSKVDLAEINNRILQDISSESRSLKKQKSVKSVTISKETIDIETHFELPKVIAQTTPAKKINSPPQIKEEIKIQAEVKPTAPERKHIKLAQPAVVKKVVVVEEYKPLPADPKPIKKQIVIDKKVDLKKREKSPYVDENAPKRYSSNGSRNHEVGSLDFNPNQIITQNNHQIQKQASHQQMGYDLEVSNIEQKKDESDQFEFDKLNKFLSGGQEDEDMSNFFNSRQGSKPILFPANALNEDDEPNMSQIFGVSEDKSELSEIVNHEDPKALLNAFQNKNYKPQTDLNKSRSEQSLASVLKKSNQPVNRNVKLQSPQQAKLNHEVRFDLDQKKQKKTIKVEETKVDVPKQKKKQEQPQQASAPVQVKAKITEESESIIVDKQEVAVKPGVKKASYEEVKVKQLDELKPSRNRDKAVSQEPTYDTFEPNKEKKVKKDTKRKKDGDNDDVVFRAANQEQQQALVDAQNLFKNEKKRSQELLEQIRQLKIQITKLQKDWSQEESHREDQQKAQLKTQAQQWADKIDQRDLIVNEMRKQMEKLRNDCNQKQQQYDELNFQLLNDTKMFQDSTVRKENEFLVARLAELGPDLMLAEGFRKKETFYKKQMRYLESQVEELIVENTKLYVSCMKLKGVEREKDYAAELVKVKDCEVVMLQQKVQELQHQVTLQYALRDQFKSFVKDNMEIMHFEQFKIENTATGTPHLNNKLEVTFNSSTNDSAHKNCSERETNFFNTKSTATGNNTLLTSPKRAKNCNNNYIECLKSNQKQHQTVQEKPKVMTSVLDLSKLKRQSKNLNQKFNTQA